MSDGGMLRGRDRSITGDPEADRALLELARTVDRIRVRCQPAKREPRRDA